MTTDQLKIHMISFYEAHRATTWKNADARSEIRRTRYATDEAYREKCKERTRRVRDQKKSSANVVAIA
jgi:hypothetical protein